jgi:hypothetical protein
LQGGQKLNAYYDRVGLSFFIFDAGNKIYYTGISTDTVTHEAGHALLDALRPEFFTSFRPEVNAFHEAFGDMWALLCALMDAAIRKAVLDASADLKSANFVESLSEYLSDAALQVFGNVAPSKPRRALNAFRYQLPTTLPPGAFEDPPELLSAEPHSFSRVFNGCFYDTLANIFAGSTKDEAGLLSAATTAAKLLIEAARTARHASRFYLEMGQRMIQADASMFGGANATAIQQAFAKHNLDLGGMGLIASPTTSLQGGPPRVTRTAANLAPATIKDIRGRIRAAKGSKISVGALNVAGEKVAEVSHLRAVPLGGVAKSSGVSWPWRARSSASGSRGRWRRSLGRCLSRTELSMRWNISFRHWSRWGELKAWRPDRKSSEESQGRASRYANLRLRRMRSEP